MKNRVSEKQQLGGGTLSLQTFNFQLPDWKSQRKIQQASEIRDRKILTMENEKEEVIILSREGE